MLLLFWSTSDGSVGVNPSMMLSPTIRRLEWPPALDDMVLGEINAVSFNFADLVRDGETLDEPTIEVTVINGVDTNKDAIIASAPEIDGTGQIVSVLISGHKAYVGYMLAMSVTTNMGRKLILEGTLRVMPFYAL